MVFDKRINKCKLLQSKIKKYSSQFPLPLDDNSTNVHTHSWFDIITNNQDTDLFDPTKLEITYDRFEHDGFYTKELVLFPNNKQKKILLK